MNKLSKRSIDKILLFLNDKEFNYVTLSKREVKILFHIYQNATSEIFELEQEKDILQHQLEEKDKVIEDAINYIKNSGRKILIEIDEILEILERGKNGMDN